MPALGDEPAVLILNGLLGEWEKLTLAETQAIHTDDWRYLQEVQAQKASLQQSIQDSEHTVFESSSLSEERKQSIRNGLKETAAELLALEQANQEVLTKRITETDGDLKQSNRAMSSLREVQKAYGRSGRSFWQAYS